MSSDANHRNPDHPAGSRSRPALTPDLSATEFGRWHWWKDELADFCRQEGLAVSGTKSMLIDRISDHLTDHTFDQIYLAFSRRYFDDHPDATLREAWRSFKWARASGRVPLGAS